MPKAELIATFGDDLMVVNAARISYDRWHDAMTDADYRLIARLARHGHNSPFYHPKMQFRITAPFYVAAQLKRHHVGFDINEVSRRYTSAEPEFELPTEWRSGAGEHPNPQVSGEPLAAWIQDIQTREMERAMAYSLETYKRALELGVAPEQARVVLPVCTLTTWFWTGSLFAYAKLCRERLAADAQPETAAVVAEIDCMARLAFPASWTALVRNPRASAECPANVRVPHEWELQPDDTLRCFGCRKIGP